MLKSAAIGICQYDCNLSRISTFSKYFVRPGANKKLMAEPQ